MANIIGRRVNVADMAFPSGGSGMRPMRPGVAPVEDSGGLSKVFSALASPYLDGVGTQLKQSQIDLLEQKIAGERMQNEGRQGVSDAFGADGPIDMRAIYGAAARGGVTDVSNLLRGFTANTQGATAPATTNAFVGAGGAYGSTASGFRESEANDTAQLLAAADRQAAAQRARDEAEFPRRIALADRESASRASLADATLVEVNTPNGPVYQRRSDAVGQAPILSNAEVEGNILARLGPDDQRSVALGTSNAKPVEVLDPVTLLPRLARPDQAIGQQPILSTDQVRAREINRLLPGAAPADVSRFAFGNEPAPRAPFNYVVNGQSFLTTDGVRDMQGNPLPPGGARAEVQGDAAGVGLRPNVEGNLQAANIAGDKFRSALTFTRDLATRSPSNFGIPGAIKGAVQDVSQMADGIAAGLGYKGAQDGMANLRAKVASEGLDPTLFAGIFDPNLPALHAASNLLVYSAAEALAGQSGRSMTDRDVKIFQTIAGNPSDWFSSQQKFLASMDMMESYLNDSQAVTQKHLGGPGAAVPAVPGAAPAPAAAPVQEESWVRGPDGVLRRAQ